VRLSSRYKPDRVLQAERFEVLVGAEDPGDTRNTGGPHSPWRGARGFDVAYAKLCLSVCKRMRHSVLQFVHMKFEPDGSRRKAVDGCASVCAHSPLLRVLPGEWRLCGVVYVRGEGVYVLRLHKKFFELVTKGGLLWGQNAGRGFVWGGGFVCLKYLGSAVLEIRGVAKFKGG